MEVTSYDELTMAQKNSVSGVFLLAPGQEVFIYKNVRTVFLEGYFSCKAGLQWIIKLLPLYHRSHSWEGACGENIV